ncbi:hypothetical protein BXZ70DRAFT_1075318 [Cristinia sonorae]|uniref:F-box domain-containing protein n=1 Tax=Cristinia sonorae TaxID=1940300 RepID=A0A8K0XTI2_9AGAR|nr:hypothetical protein BXZ70DRAFT_1075318 [Cristinia sonorae]
MPPRRTRRAAQAIDSEQVQPIANASLSVANDHVQLPGLTSDVVQRPPLALIPPELFDEIVAYWPTLPLRYYSDTYGVAIAPHIEHATRTVTLRALSQTCRALRAVCLPRLWSRLETCWVPWSDKGDYPKSGKWYTYVMLEMQRKANGLLASEEILRSYVRTFCFMTSKSKPQVAMPALASILPALPNLHTIQVLHCNNAGDVAAAVGGLQLPSVRVAVIPSECNSILKACPNVTHVRCAGGNGAAIVTALKYTKVEVLDGMIDWGSKNIMDRLVKNAPNLHTLEIRRPVSGGLGIASQNTAPAVWAEVIPKLAALLKLRVLQLSFPDTQESPSDLVSIAAARKVMKESSLKKERKLVVRRVLAPHYTRSEMGREDVVDSSVEEIFE